MQWYQCTVCHEKFRWPVIHVGNEHRRRGVSDVVSDERPTLLEAASEDDSVYVLTPREKIEDLAADVILRKLDRLKEIKEIIDAWDAGCCVHCDSKTLKAIAKVIK